MYLNFFGLREMPFSITPDPAYLYMSPRHQEALGHLLYGTGQHGGFVQLTGEVGTGKTTVIRTLLAQKIEGVDVAMIHNPRQSEQEFVQTICDEFGVIYDRTAPSLKTLVDALNAHLLAAHAQHRRTVLIIDEAQNLDPGVLEQVRLLTNLETHKEKLLRIMLVGQPELADLLARPDLRQLAQRITARYHLTPLSGDETREYVAHRLRVAGTEQALFSDKALHAVHAHSRGVPRLVNIICDRALLGAYGLGQRQVTPEIVKRAADEAVGTRPVMALPPRRGNFWERSEKIWAPLAVLLAGTLVYQNLFMHSVQPPAPAATTAPVVQESLPEPVPAAMAPAVDVQAQQQLLGQTQGLSVVMNKLILRWSADVRIEGGQNICAGLARHQLECYRTQGSWSDLAQMNRPAVLVLQAGDGSRHHALLHALDSTQAWLDGENGVQPYPLEVLDDLWTGEFLLLWKRETALTHIDASSRGEAVVWLRKRLAQLAGVTLTPPLSGFYDAPLAEALRRFQILRGLEPDGVAGIRTLIALGDAQPGTPTLNGAP